MHKQHATLKGFSKNLLTVTLPSIILCLIFAELFFRTVIQAAAPPQFWFDEQELISKFYPNQGPGTMTFGKLASIKSKWKTNNDGWNSALNYKEKKSLPRIAVIGDSYIEAFQVDFDKNYPALLGRHLKNQYDVYAFGQSGYPLSQYLHVSRYVNEHYSPDILIFNLIHNDFDESIRKYNAMHSQFLTVSLTDSGIIENKPVPNHSYQQYHWGKRLLFKSAAVRYFVKNLKGLHFFDLTDLSGSNRSGSHHSSTYNSNVNVDEIFSRLAEIRAATRYILEQIKLENQDKRILFVMDAPRRDIYQKNVKQSSVLFLNKMVAELCRSLELELIDLTKPMVRDYLSNKKPFNSDIDGHWNERGHAIVAEQIFRYLLQTYRSMFIQKSFSLK